MESTNVPHVASIFSAWPKAGYILITYGKRGVRCTRWIPYNEANNIAHRAELLVVGGKATVALHANGWSVYLDRRISIALGRWT